jgi:hypothetical protein
LAANLRGSHQNFADRLTALGKKGKGVTGLIHRFDPDQTRREIDEELRFHLDLLTEEHCHLDVPFAEARDAALKQFGNVEQIKNECVEISCRRRPAVRLLKSFLLLVFLAGVLVRVFSPEYHLTRVGDILMAVGLLGRLWLYVRFLNPSRFLSEAQDSAPLKLNDSQISIAAYDQSARTPVERVISYK